MKNLELTQMEEVQGGGCTERALFLGLALTGFVAGSIASGGLLTVTVGISMLSSAASFGAMVESGECF